MKGRFGLCSCEADQFVTVVLAEPRKSAEPRNSLTEADRPAGRDGTTHASHVLFLLKLLTEPHVLDTLRALIR